MCYHTEVNEKRLRLQVALNTGLKPSKPWKFKICEKAAIAQRSPKVWRCRRWMPIPLTITALNNPHSRSLLPQRQLPSFLTTDLILVLHSYNLETILISAFCLVGNTAELDRVVPGDDQILCRFLKRAVSCHQRFFDWLATMSGSED